MAWTPAQMANARVIIAVGQEMKMSSRDILIGLMTAMQESSLNNPRVATDHDSLGLFQQRPSQGWGTPSQVMDPIYASRKFFSSLKGIRNRNNMSLTQAAQAVQRSAYPDAYAKHENEAKRLMLSLGVKGGGYPFPLNTPKTSLGDVDLLNPDHAQPGPAMAMAPAAGTSTAETDERSPGMPGLGSAVGQLLAPAQARPEVKQQGSPLTGFIDPKVSTANPMPGTNHTFPALTSLLGGGARATIVKAALGQVGKPYVWGTEGPSSFDCSGLVWWAFKQAGINFERGTADDMAHMGKLVPVSQLEPGDLMVRYNGDHKTFGHVGIYVGNNRMVDARGKAYGVVTTAARTDMIGVKLSLAGMGTGTYVPAPTNKNPDGPGSVPTKDQPKSSLKPDPKVKPVPTPLGEADPTQQLQPLQYAMLPEQISDQALGTGGYADPTPLLNFPGI